MELQCFMCEKMLGSPDYYISHLKEHVIPINFLYECTFLGCYQKFHSKFSFKRHLGKHFKKNINENRSVFPIKDVNVVEVNNEDVHVSVVEPNNGDDVPQCSNPCYAIKSFNYDKSLSDLFDLSTTFITKLHSFSNFSRSDVSSIRKFVEDLVLNPVLKFIEESQNSGKPLSCVLSDAKDLFKNVKTDFKLENTLKEKGLIGNVENFRICHDTKCNGVLMPLETQFKNIFEKNDYLSKVLQHMDNLEKNDKFIDFTQGELWRQKKSLYPNEILVPFFLYGDDFGINNPLGSKSNRHSMCNFYYNFPTVPQKSSKLSEVHLACSIKSCDYKKYGNESLIPLVNLLIKLETVGIDIKTKNGTKNVKFILGLILGDNLGLNVFLGFSKSFSSHYYCRFCLTRKSEAQKECCENKNVLRNRINYNESIERGLMAENGVSMVCIFNNIPSFHCTENFCVDIMHDFYEGVCHQILCESLLYFIKKMHYLTLEEINQRLKSFKYDYHDHGSEKLSISFLELENHKLKMSAKQMMAFCHYFTILIGEFINCGDPVWIFLLRFFELIDDILCYEISNALIEQIKNKIEYLNKNFQTLFKRNLTPKFHILLHYTTVIRQSGPLRNYWCFKYEGKHKEFKIYSHIITSRKNMPKSFSFKQQISFTNCLLEKDKEDIVFYCQSFKSDLKTKISNKLRISLDNFSLYLEANIWGYNYSSKKVIAKFSNDFEFFKINLIIKTTYGKIILCCNQIFTEFNTHFSAYEYLNISNQYTFLDVNDIVGPPISQITSTQGKQFLKLKEFYKNIY